MQTIEQVKAYLGAEVKGVGTKAAPFFSTLNQSEQKLQYKINRALEPHFKGLSPKDLFDTAFQDERPELRAKRLSIYKSKSKAELDKALTSVMRLIIGNKFRINADSNVLARLGLVDFGDSYSFTDWLCSNVYRVRAYDPNGLVACQAKILTKDNKLVAISPNEEVTTEFVIYHSNQIEYLDENLAIVRLSTTMLRVFTKTTNFVVNNDFTVLNQYNHNSQSLGVCSLGGSLVRYLGMNETYYEAYESDFAGLKDVLDALAVYVSNQQLISSTAYVTRIIYSTENCGHCGGTGKVWDEVAESETECPHCNGHGSKRITIADDIHIKVPQREDNTAVSSLPFSKPIEFAAPPKDVFEQSNYLVETLVTDLKEGLNTLIYQSTNTSGVSKEKDREPSYLFLANAAKALSEIAYKLLRAFCGFLSVSPQIVQSYADSIEIIKPTHFALDDINDLETKAATNVATKSQLQRYNEQRDIIVTRYGIDSIQLRAFDIACKATNLNNLFLSTELITMVQNGLMGANEARNAMQCYSLALNMVESDTTIDTAKGVDLVKKSFIA